MPHHYCRRHCYRERNGMAYIQAHLMCSHKFLVENEHKQ
jgi:hypothetical protein